MWRETKLLLIDDNLDRSRDLAVILNFLGEDQLTCNSEDWREVAAGLSNSREALCVLLGSVESKGGAVELLKQLASWDEYLPILLIGEPAPADWPEELRRRVLASLEMPPSYNKLLDSCIAPRSTARCTTRPASAAVPASRTCSAAWSAPAGRSSRCGR